MFDWLRRRHETQRRLSVYPTPQGLSLALSDRDETGALVVRWTEHLGFDSQSIDFGLTLEIDEPAPLAGDRRAEQRGGQDRRGADRRATDRRQGDRRQGDRRDQKVLATPGRADASPPNPKLVELLQRIVRERDLRNVPCTGLLRSGDYSLVLLDSLALPPSEIRGAVRWQLREMIDFPAEESVIDVFDIPERDGHAARRMYAVAARRERVQQLVNLLNTADLEIKTIDIPELALRNIAAMLPEDEGGVALISLDRQQGLMTITRQEALYFARRVDCGTERLLTASIGPGLTPALESLLDGLIIEVQRSLDFYERNFNQTPVTGIVIAPVPGVSTRLCEYMQSQLGIPVRWLDLGRECDVEVPDSLLLEGISVLGAALRDDKVTL